MLQARRTVEVVSDVTGTSPETIYKVYRHHLQSHTRREANTAWANMRGQNPPANYADKPRAG